LKTLYLALAIIGAVVPYLFFGQFFMEHGVHLPSFVNALFVNGAAGGFSADVLISSAAFWVYMYNQKAGPQPAWFILLNLSIGLSCALPAYLYATYHNSQAS